MTKKSNKKVILSHYSALIMICYARILGAKLIMCEDEKIFHNARCPNVNEAMLLSQFINKQTGKSYKIDILLESENKKSNSKILTCHGCNVKIPEKYFCKIVSNDNVLNDVLFKNFVVVCPEFAILQLSRMVPAWRLLQWTIEFMSNYVIDNNRDVGFSVCDPIMNNTEKLKKMISNINNINKNNKLGNKSILQICINYAEGGSASPAETNLYILLCGPRSLGFFQIHKLVFNRKIMLSNSATRLCGQDIVIPDLINPDKKIAIEYDSKTFHENLIQDQKDKRRFLALEHDGWKVFTVVPYQMNNYKSFYEIALDILKACDQDLRIKSSKFQSCSYKNFYSLLHR